MLNTFLPLAFIAATVSPIHLAVPIALILTIAAFVDISACPSKYSLAMFFVSYIITLIMSTFRPLATAPLSFSFFHTSFELSYVTCTILPSVLAFSFRLTIYVITWVYITIDEYIWTCAVFKAHSPFSFKSISIFPDMQTIAMCFALVPFTYVAVIKQPTPDSVTVF